LPPPAAGENRGFYLFAGVFKFFFGEGLSQKLFRSTRLKEHIEYIFSQTVHLLVRSGFIALKDAFVDGTKIEANANRYSLTTTGFVQQIDKYMLKNCRGCYRRFDQ